MKKFFNKKSALIAIFCSMCITLAACNSAAADNACEGHRDQDSDGKCDLCGEAMYIVPNEVPNESQTEETSETSAAEETDNTNNESGGTENKIKAEAGDYYSFSVDNAELSQTDAATSENVKIGDVKANMKLSVNSDSEFTGEFSYDYTPSDNSDPSNAAASGTVSLSWKYNEDWLKYDNNYLIVYVDASNDGVVAEQKCLFSMSESGTYSGTVNIKGIPVTLSGKVGIEASLKGTAQDPVWAETMGDMAGSSAVTLNVYSDGTASLVADDGVGGYFSGVSVNAKGLWSKELLGCYNVELSNGGSVAVSAKGTAYSATVNLGYGYGGSEVVSELAYDSTNITMKGFGTNTTQNEQGENIDNPITIILTANIQTNTAKLEVLMNSADIDFSILVSNTSESTGMVYGGMCLEIGEGVITEGSEAGTYDVTFTYSANDTVINSVVTYTVNEDGSYSAVFGKDIEYIGTLYNEPITAVQQ